MNPTQRKSERNSDQYGVVIIHYSNAQNTVTAIESVLQSSPQIFRPIVVCNGSKVPYDALQKKYGDTVEWIISEKNLGFSGGNNLGMKWAQENLSGESVFLLNDDATVEKNALNFLLEFLQKNPNAGAACPSIYFHPGREFHQGYQPQEIGNVFWYAGGCIDWTEVVGFHRGVDEVDRGQYSEPDQIGFTTGCCVGYKLQALQEVGFLKDEYFLYFEDTELSERMKRKGWQIWFVPQAKAWHQNAGSSSSGSDLHVYYQTRNRYFFGFQYAPWRTKLFLLKNLIREWRNGTPTVKHAILDVITLRYGQRKINST